ncbi:MAG: hypothetical protein AAFS13_01030 [Pseudomonadota bacterium]
MYSEKGLIAGICACLAVSGAEAQVEAAALDDVNPWAVGFLAEDEGRLPGTLWSASEPDTLLALLRTTRTRNLSPGERLLLSQLVFSAGEAPEGELNIDLLAERARIILDLGEADIASQLFPLLSEPVGDADPEELAVDLLLGLGNEDSACAASESQAREGAFWAKLRAVCFALEGETGPAELALELAISEGVEDPWFYEAVFAAIDLAPTPPPARYDSGIALSLSARAELPVPTDAIASSRADLAAAIAINDNLQPDLRVQAAGIAAEASLIDAQEHRAAYKALLEIEDFTPRTPVEIAISANWQGDEAVDTKARTLHSALRTAEGNLSRYHAVSRLLLDDINALPKADATLRYGLTFARANLAAGDIAASSDWITALSSGDADADEAFDHIWARSLLRFTGQSADGDGSLAIKLVERADTPKKREAMRRLLVLWSAFDIPLGPGARAALTADPSEDGDPVFPMLLRAINAAANDGAAAELILHTLKLTAGDPSNVRSSDMAQILEALRVIGAEEAARQLALESTGFWKREL